MCTYLTEKGLRSAAAGNGPSGWFRVTDVSVYFDHPVHAQAMYTRSTSTSSPRLRLAGAGRGRAHRGVGAGAAQGDPVHPGLGPSRPDHLAPFKAAAPRDPEPPECQCLVSVCMWVPAVGGPGGMEAAAMRFMVGRDTLAEAVAWVSRSLPSRPVLPILSGLLLEADSDGLTLSCFDYEVSARIRVDAEVAAPGTALVPGRLLAEITREPAAAGGRIRLRRE